MCGIAGFVGDDVGNGSPESVIRAMTDAIRHRGPDDAGFWIDHDARLVLGHRRLSILDLSDAGHQPMHSDSGRFIIVFNGEIYNHLNIRQALEKEKSIAWRSHSDTETLLGAIACWGVKSALKKISGMFAFALWDRQEKLLTLARDRVGEKPLYYGVMGSGFVFGSELSSLEQHPASQFEVDRGALNLYLKYNHVPDPLSIYQNIFKLEPGAFLEVSVDVPGKVRCGAPIKYWDYNKVVEKGIANPFEGSYEEAADELEAQLLKSVRSQLISDVPVGAFLSGGIDSSVITAMMQSCSSQPVKTFTIGFGEKAFNEAEHAKEVASYLGTDHTELYFSHQDALNVVPEIPKIYSEPFSDSSQLPTYLLSKLTKQHVQVALSGDAGDELFAGYNRYLSGYRTWEHAQKMPRWVRVSLAQGMRAISPESWDKIYGVSSGILPKKLQVSRFGLKVQKLSEVMNVDDKKEFYKYATSLWKNSGQVVVGGERGKPAVDQSEFWPVTDCFQHAMMAADAKTYLPGDILVKVDRAAMAASLETRVPFLDPAMIELAWSLPIHYKIKDGSGKSVLKDVLYRHVPRDLIDRPKQGFGVPISDWLRGPLRSWAEDLLDEKKMKEQGFFDQTIIHKAWKEHLSGKRNWSHHLWSVLVFQQWLNK